MSKYGFYFPAQYRINNNIFNYWNFNDEIVQPTMVIDAKDEAEAVQEFNKYQQRFGEGEFLGPLKEYADIQPNPLPYSMGTPLYHPHY